MMNRGVVSGSSGASFVHGRRSRLILEPALSALELPSRGSKALIMFAKHPDVRVVRSFVYIRSRFEKKKRRRRRGASPGYEVQSMLHDVVPMSAAVAAATVKTTSSSSRREQPFAATRARPAAVHVEFESATFETKILIGVLIFFHTHSKPDAFLSHRSKPNFAPRRVRRGPSPPDVARVKVRRSRHVVVARLTARLPRLLYVCPSPLPIAGFFVRVDSHTHVV